MLDFLQQKTLKKLKLTSNIFVLHLEINDIYSCRKNDQEASANTFMTFIVCQLLISYRFLRFKQQLFCCNKS